jgi:UrcA family protein
MAVAYMPTNHPLSTISTRQETIMNTSAHPPIRFRGLIATAVLSLLTSSFTSVCAAGDNSDIPKVLVKYGDLNVSDRQGAAALFRRIRGAAEAVCPAFDRSVPESKIRMDACVHKAVADAVAKVNQPQLFAIYGEKNRTPLPSTLVSQNR